MDPRAVKNFMQAMGKGFDQMDFKSRLKMQFMVGVKETREENDKDVQRKSKAFLNAADLPKDIAEEFSRALQGSDNIKKMAAVTAKAQARGVSGTNVYAMTDMARQQELNHGDVLDRATSMKSMGMIARLHQIRSQGQFGTGKLTGLGEHVASQMGIAGPELKALQDLDSTLATMGSQLSTIGRTSSKSINASLKKQLGFDKNKGEKDEDYNARTDKLFEDAMKDISSGKKKPPAGFKNIDEMIELASTEQMAQDEKTAENDKKNAGTLEDFAKEQVQATFSIKDKIENVLQVILEKIYDVLNGAILSKLGDLYYVFNKGDKETAKEIVKSRAAVLTISDPAAKDYYLNAVDQLSDSTAIGDSVHDMENKFAPIMAFATDDEKNKLKNTSGGNNQAEAVEIISKVALREAQKKKGGYGYGVESRDSKYNTAKERAEKAEKTGDLDKRSGELVGGITEHTNTGASIHLGSYDPDHPKGISGPELKALQDMDSSTAGPAAAVGGPTSTSSTSAGGQSPTTIAKETLKVGEDHADTAEEALQRQEDDYNATKDMLSLLKKGIKFEQSWMGSKFKAFLADVLLEQLRTALLEQASILNPDAVMDVLKKFKDDNNGKLPETLAELAKSRDKDFVGNNESDHAANRVAQLHKSEMVPTRNDVQNTAANGGNGRLTNIGEVHVHVYGGDANKVRQVVDDMHNKGQ